MWAVIVDAVVMRLAGFEGEERRGDQLGDVAHVTIDSSRPSALRPSPSITAQYGHAWR